MKWENSMLRRLCISTCIVAFSFGTAAAAQPRTFAISFVSAKVPRGALGDDAGIDVTGGRYVRLTASGAVSLASYGACGRSIGPNGCSSAMSFARVAPNAPTGSLVLSFVDAAGHPVTSWAEAGDAAFVVIPQRAARLLLRVNGTTGQETGRFRVAADVVSSGSTGSTAIATGGVHRYGSARQVATSTAFTRASVQHLLRRFGFSDTPANVSAVYSEGATAWLTAQLNPSGINDSALTTYMDPIPVYTGTTADNNIPNIVQDRIIQREVSSQRQLLEKMTLHWLEHFAVSEDKVNDIGAMAHYEDTVRADALGNFAQLVTDVSQEPAMLYWLDNNYNNGSNPGASPPNENFGRELMQLYTIGETKLNQDGSIATDSNGNPIPNYGEPDVKTMALALTGFQVTSPYPEPTGVDIRTIDQVSFNVHAHANGPFYFFPTSEGVGSPATRIIDPGNNTIVNQAVQMLATNPSTAPFQVTELLQRFVTEDPSPGYISRVSAVWTANESDPNQLAKVMNAIATDPEFYTSQHSMVKEPIEYANDAVRALGGETASPVTASDATPLDEIRNDDGNMAEAHYYPPSVFSFYRPGQKESLVTNSELLSRWSNAVDIANAAHVTGSCTTCSLSENLSNLASMTPAQQTGYLMDALVDGGSPELQALVENYLMGNHTGYSGALWLVLTSPEYEVN
jgi:uncharacterized protein (DUF1800 family)